MGVFAGAFHGGPARATSRAGTTVDLPAINRASVAVGTGGGGSGPSTSSNEYLSYV